MSSSGLAIFVKQRATTMALTTITILISVPLQAIATAHTISLLLLLLPTSSPTTPPNYSATTTPRTQTLRHMWDWRTGNARATALDKTTYGTCGTPRLSLPAIPPFMRETFVYGNPSYRAQWSWWTKWSFPSGCQTHLFTASTLSPTKRTTEPIF